MPSSAELLRSVSTIANALVPVAIAWHLAIAVALVAIVAGWRPSLRVALVLVATPALSVSMCSFAYRNPFNGISLAVLAGLLCTFAGAARAGETARAAPWSTWLGAALIAFGLVYPHFVTGSWWRDLYAAPVGVLPCPTLSLIAGFTLLAGGFRGRAISAVLAAWTAFYAGFGIARLGVAIDAALVAATVGLLAVSVRGIRLHSPRGAHGYSR